MDDTADHFGIKDKTKFNTEVREAMWHETEQEWEVITDKRERLKANFIINATGRLHVPVTPEFRGTMQIIANYNLFYQTLSFHFQGRQHSLAQASTLLSGQRVMT